MPRRGKYFPELRAELKRQDIDLPYLAKCLGCSVRAVQFRLANDERRTWRLEEMYQILEILGKPDESLGFYFPNYKEGRRGA